jgi:beta-mannosidase
MNEQSLALRLLDKNCYELDRDKPYIKTSPLMNVGHGYYIFLYWDDFDIMAAMQKAERIAYVEFGVSSLSSVEQLKQIIPADELFPITKTESWIAHHGYNAWNNQGWLFPEVISHYFGEPKTLEQTVYYYDWLQCEGLKFSYEEARRQSPYCSMALNWCYNEPWRIAANNSIVEYPCKPKPAFYAVKDACRPVLAGARFPRFDYKPGDVFKPQIWLLNDTGCTVKAGTVTVYIKINGEKIKIADWNYPESDTNIQGMDIEYTIPVTDAEYFCLVLESGDSGEYSSEYKLRYCNV